MDTIPNQEKKQITPEIPTYFLKLMEGCSDYTKLANQYWIVVAFFSIFAIFPSLKGNYYELPFSLGSYEPSAYNEITFFLVTVSIVCFAAVFAQALRARRLVQRAADAIIDTCLLPGPVHLQDAMDILLHPAFTRVSPIAKILQFKNRFLPEARELPFRKSEKGFWFYFMLKTLAELVVYGFPLAAAIYSFAKSIKSTSPPPYWVFCIMIILLLFSVISLSLLAADEYIAAFKIRKRLKDQSSRPTEKQ